MKNELIYITGASGLVARYLINDLLNNTDYNIVSISSNPEIVKRRHNNIRLNCIDYKSFLNDVHILDNNIKRNVKLIHCAFTRRNIASEVKYAIDLSKEIFIKCRETNIKGIINISSRSVYKEPTEGTLNTEDSDLDLSSLISLGKYTSELLLSTVCYKTDIRYSNLRLASVNELKTDNNMIRPLNVFVDNMIMNQNIKIIGGMQVMSYIDPNDVASAIRSILWLNENKWQTIYNIGTGWMCTDTLINMAKIVIERGVKFGIKPVNIEIESKQVDQHAGLDITRIKNDTNWTPNVSLEEMIDKIYIMKLDYQYKK